MNYENDDYMKEYLRLKRATDEVRFRAITAIWVGEIDVCSINVGDKRDDFPAMEPKSIWK